MPSRGRAQRDAVPPPRHIWRRRRVAAWLARDVLAAEPPEPDADEDDDVRDLRDDVAEHVAAEADAAEEVGPRAVVERREAVADRADGVDRPEDRRHDVEADRAHD